MANILLLLGILAGAVTLYFLAAHARVRWEMQRGLSARGRHRFYWALQNGLKSIGLRRIWGLAAAAVPLGLYATLAGRHLSDEPEIPGFAEKSMSWQEYSASSCATLRLEMARLSRDLRRTLEGDNRMRDLSRAWEQRCSGREKESAEEGVKNTTKEME